MTSHHVTCHVTAVSHVSSSYKRKIKETYQLLVFKCSITCWLCNLYEVVIEEPEVDILEKIKKS